RGEAAYPTFWHYPNLKGAPARCSGVQQLEKLSMKYAWLLALSLVLASNPPWTPTLHAQESKAAEKGEKSEEKGEEAKDEAKKDEESKKDEATKDEATKDEAKKDEAKKDEAKKDEE